MAVGCQKLYHVARMEVRQALILFLSNQVWEFTANFWELSPDFENDFNIVYAGEPQDARTWPSLIDRAQKMTVRLNLVSKL